MLPVLLKRKRKKKKRKGSSTQWQWDPRKDGWWNWPPELLVGEIPNDNQSRFKKLRFVSICEVRGNPPFFPSFFSPQQYFGAWKIQALSCTHWLHYCSCLLTAEEYASSTHRRTIGDDSHACDQSKIKMEINLGHMATSHIDMVPIEWRPRMGAMRCPCQT